MHPEHDAVSREVHRWYNSAVPEIGLDGAAHWFGFACMTGADRARVVLSIDDPAEVRARSRPRAPAARYRRLGFTDEVYWRRYELSR